MKLIETQIYQELHEILVEILQLKDKRKSHWSLKSGLLFIGVVTILEKCLVVSARAGHLHPPWPNGLLCVLLLSQNSSDRVVALKK